MNNLQINKLESKLDNSMSFKKTFDSLLVKSQTPQQVPGKITMGKTENPTSKKLAKNEDKLNDWNYCNPENIKDELPQPYRFIDKCLNELILKPVYEKVFEIEKFKQDCNYEGNVKELPPQGSFEFDGITVMQKDEKNPYNHVIAGDRTGNLYLLDLNKKVQISKKEVSPGNQLMKIDTCTIPYGPEYLTTIAVIARGDPKVYILRYLSTDNRIFLNYEISLKQGDNSAQNYPFSATLSYSAEFIAVSSYKGDVSVYQVPEPPEPVCEVISEDTGPVLLSAPGTVQQSPQQMTPKQKKISQAVSFEKKVEAISDAFYKIEFKGKVVQPSYKDQIKKLLLMQQTELKEQEAQAEATKAKDVKKEAKKGAKQQQVQSTAEDAQALQQQALMEIKPEIRFNQTFDLAVFKQDPANDPAMTYQALVYFQTDKLVVLNHQKFFGRAKDVKLVTGITVLWTNTNQVETHALQALKSYNLSKYIFNQYFIQPLLQSQEQKPGQQTEEQRQQLQSIQQKQKQSDESNGQFKKQLIKSYETIYPISCACQNSSGSFMALGLINGSILIWDINTMAERMYLDKHVESVTCMEFFENWKLVSGSADGGVHIYNLSTKKLEMKRTNLFREKRAYSIKGISISETGVAFVLDSLQNLRMYDLYHYEKIARLVVSTQLDSKFQGWLVHPKAVMNAQKEQLCVVSILKAKESQGQLDQNAPVADNVSAKPSSSSQTNIQIIKIFDSLINLFPGLSNVFRKGVDKDKIANLFSKISMKELKDPSFEVPQIGPSPAQKQIIQADQHSVSSSCRKSIQKSKASIISQQNLQQSQAAGRASLDANKKNGESSHPQQQVYPIKLHQASQKSLDSEIDLNVSLKTQKTVSSQTRSKQKTQKQSLPLTKEILHPEEYWFQKEIIGAPELNTNIKETIENARKIYEQGQQNSVAVQQQMLQYGKVLQQKEEIRLLEKRKQLLQQSPKKAL